MLASSIPTKFPIPFANSAGPSFIRPVPVASQIGTNPGAASDTDGFVPLNFLVPSAGGIPPDGRDVNGILNQMSAWDRWVSVGGAVFYDAAQSTAIGGYPHGALLNAVGIDAGYWWSEIDNNTSNPDTGGANWLFIQMGNPATFSLSGYQVFTSSGSFTVPSLVSQVFVRVWGAGGGGGGVLSTGAYSASGGAAGGGYTEGYVTVTPAQVITVTVGSGGSAGTGVPSNGGTGGTSSFGAFMSATGGVGGHLAGNGVIASSQGSGGTGTGGGLSVSGFAGNGGLGATNGGGGSGGGAFQSSTTPGNAINGAGSVGSFPGGGGAGCGASSTGGFAGGLGSGGMVVVNF